MLLHVSKRAVLQNISSLVLRHRHIQEIRNAANLALQIRLQVVEMHQQQVRQIPRGVPAADRPPKRQRDGVILIVLDKIEEVLPRVGRRSLQSGSDSAGRIVDHAVEDRGGVVVVVV